MNTTSHPGVEIKPFIKRVQLKLPQQSKSAVPASKKVPLGKWEREEIEDDIEGNGSINLEGKQPNKGIFHSAGIQTRLVKKDYLTHLTYLSTINKFSFLILNH